MKIARIPGPKFVVQFGESWLVSAEWGDRFRCDAGTDMIGVCPYWYLGLGPYLFLLINRAPLDRYSA
jgi:hypothetical protein